MSRIGNAAVVVPNGVDVTIAGLSLTVKGPKGTLSRVFPTGVSIAREENTIVVTRDNEERDCSLDSGRRLQCAEAQGPSKLKLALGFSHPVVIDAPEGVTFEVPAQTKIIVKGADKEVVGQVAANIREIRKPEPYKGKGVRYLNEKVLRKAGKTGKK